MKFWDISLIRQFVKTGSYEANLAWKNYENYELFNGIESNTNM